MHQRARLSSFGAFYGDAWGLAIVLLSGYIGWQSSSPWCSLGCCWGVLSLSGLVAASELLLPEVARCIPVLSSRHMGECAVRALGRSVSAEWAGALVNLVSDLMGPCSPCKDSLVCRLS